MYDLIADTALIAATSAYAHWLRDHKGAEPDFVFLEVALGTVMCLAHAEALGRRHGGGRAMRTDQHADTISQSTRGAWGGGL